MNAIALLEACNPRPEPRGNPGPCHEPQRQQTRSWLARGLAVAAAIVAFGAVVATRSSEPVELEVAAQVEATPDEAMADTGSARVTPTPVQYETPDLAPAPGLVALEPGSSEAVARLIIPAIDVDQTVVDDVTVTALRKGPGHYPATAFPGQAGNAAIAGHRTTYGAPFINLDRLVAGDSIFVTTAQGVFEYRVDGQSIVDPEDLSVLADSGENQLTMITPHPKYTNRERLVVVSTLVGEPALPLSFAHFPLVEEIEWNDGDDIVDITEVSSNRSQPYLAFEGDADVLATATAFVESQFGEWADHVELSIVQQTEEATAVRWADATHETGGWIIVSGGNRQFVYTMTMDGVHAPMYQSQTGGRGVFSAQRQLQIEVLRPVPFSMSPETEPYIDGPLSAEPLVVSQIGGAVPETIVTFEVEPGERFQEVRMVVRNADGEQVGGLATSLFLTPIDERALFTSVDDSHGVRALLASSPEVIAGPLEWDRWQSIDSLAEYAPDLLPTDVDEVPTHEMTTFALRAISTPQQFEDQVELFQLLQGSGVLVSLPAPGSEPQLRRELPERAHLYEVEELPSVDICRLLQAIGWARPEVQIINDPQVFATPEEARDSNEQTATGHLAEFRVGDGSVIGFARPTNFDPWRFASLAVVEQVDDGWVLDRWERANC